MATLALRLFVPATLCLASACTTPETHRAEPHHDKSGDTGGEAAGPESSGPRTATAPHPGLPDELAWRTLDEAKAEAKRDGRPIMLVVHTSWCPRCKELSKQLGNDELVMLSERFAVVNLDQDNAPEAMDFSSSGTYVPRVLFLDAEGRIDESIVNARSPRYPYFYTSARDVIASMRSALAKHESHG